MALEQVFSDRDSEDEVDDDIADFEDKRVRYNHICFILFVRKHKIYIHAVAYTWAQVSLCLKIYFYYSPF